MVWTKLGGPADLPPFYTQSLKIWIKSDLQTSEKEGYPIWGTLFCVSIWWIWKWRNSIVFGRNQEVPQDIGGFIHVRYNEARRGIERTTSVCMRPPTTNVRVEVGVSWKPPPMDWYVINTDGAAKGVPGQREVESY